MKQQYIVAENLFTVTAADELSEWKKLRNRFSPFEVKDTEQSPVLEIEITSAPIPEDQEGTKVYEPEYGGIGIITGSVASTPDGGLIMDFRHIREEKTRLRMIMPATLNKAEILLDCEGDANAPYFINHAVMIAYMLSTCANGTLLIHASSIIFDGKAYLFQGKSGTGKSTHASLWVRHIEGAELLNDDNPVIRFSADGTATAYGSPWSGKTDCYRNLSAPIGAFVRIVRAKENRLVRLTPLKGYASLMTSIFFMPFLNADLRTIRHSVIERLATSVGCYEMHCLPNEAAALTCRQSLTES